MNLFNKKVLITGASEGIGREIALNLSKQQCRLVLLARNADLLNECASDCLKAGAKHVDTYAFDLADNAALKTTLTKIINEHPDLAVLINNAGIWQKMGDLDTVSLEDIETILTVNLVSLVKITRLLLPVLRLQPEAAIINISSRSGIEVRKGQSVYAASKYGVRGFTDVLKEDLKETNIRVAGLYQAGTQTKLFEKAGENLDTSKYINPKDLASVICFMLSQPEKIWINDIRLVY